MRFRRFLRCAPNAPAATIGMAAHSRCFLGCIASRVRAWGKAAMIRQEPPDRLQNIPRRAPTSRMLRHSSMLLLTLLIPAAADSRHQNARSHQALHPQAQCRRIEISGEVDAGREWSAPIGQGWLFRLVPIASSGQDYSGWDLVVSPVDDGDYPDALLLGTPPYGSLNEREIGTTYGMRAQDAIAWTPRRFQFLASIKNLARARGLYRTIMPQYPTGSDARSNSGKGDAIVAGRSQAARQLLGLLSAPSGMGSGEFSVLDARLTAGIIDPPPFAQQWVMRLRQVPHTIAPSGGSPSPRGRLLWIRFKAELQLPAQWKEPPGIGENAAKCAQ